MADSVDLTENRQTEILLVAWIMTGAAILTVAIKLFARVRVVHVIGWDDLFIILSLIFSITASAFVHYGVVLGFGQHTVVVAAEFGEERLFKGAMIQMLGYPFNIAAFSFPNISITILVCQILSPNPHRTIALYFMAVLQVVLGMITIALAFAQCQPINKLWEKTLPGSCWNPGILNYFSYAFCAYTTLTDVVLAVVPAHTFWRLQMPWTTKVSVIIMMGLTMLSAVVTIVKGTYLPLFTDMEDPLWNPVPLVIWGLVEQNIVIMAACVPTMRPFFERAWKYRFSTRSGSHLKTPSQGASQYPNKTRSLLECRAGSMSDVALNDIGTDANTINETTGECDASSHESHQGILKTIDVNIDWQEGIDKKGEEKGLRSNGGM
ncbi:uncharacterized protein yc1106_00970 [Curvularia clavata]|uniref:Rhodopsin domain-containing protein n=1 Tax=Curvularia clavata TaxID=95742 RepID=A0A9Q8Z0M9_CURCL|nr:uncharacterized protein yc1106_00970 [Curvularia clavata]